MAGFLGEGHGGAANGGEGIQ